MIELWSWESGLFSSQIAYGSIAPGNALVFVDRSVWINIKINKVIEY